MHYLGAFAYDLRIISKCLLDYFQVVCWIIWDYLLDYLRLFVGLLLFADYLRLFAGLFEIIADDHLQVIWDSKLRIFVGLFAGYLWIFCRLLEIISWFIRELLVRLYEIIWKLFEHPPPALNCHDLNANSIDLQMRTTAITATQKSAYLPGWLITHHQWPALLLCGQNHLVIPRGVAGWVNQSMFSVNIDWCWRGQCGPRGCAECWLEFSCPCMTREEQFQYWSAFGSCNLCTTWR